MPPTPEPPAHITIRVKVPPGYLSTTDDSSGSESFLLGSEVPVTANVGALRQQIQQLIPTHPPPERQRLLYGGRALVDNEQRLADALNIRRDPTQTEYVVHLLVKGEQGTGEGGPAHRRAVSTPPTQTPGAQQPPTQMPFQQAPNGQRAPFPIPGGQFMPHQQPFPQIIARNQQMRAGMGMQGVGGQHAQGQGQPSMTSQAEQDAGGGQTGPQNQQPGPNGEQGVNGPPDNSGHSQPGHHHPHVPGRPISGQGFHVRGVGPNGQHFQIHQQTMQFPLGGGQPGQMPFGFPHMPQIPGMMAGAHPHGFPAPAHGLPPQTNGPSAIDRARENMAEMRRVLEEMRTQNGTTEDQQRRIGEVQQRAQVINEYIDPFQLGRTNSPNAQRTSPANANEPSGNRSTRPPPFAPTLPPLFNAPRRPAIPTPPHAQHHVQRPSNPNEVTAYLLSSPQGPQALLFSPQHGQYTGSLAQNARPQPTPTTTHQQAQQPGQQQQQPQDPVAQAAHRAAQELQVQHAQLHAAQANQQAQADQDPLGPVQAILAHFWLLFRILIFAYFFMGSNMGWQRPLLLLGIGFGFWMVRAGALGDMVAVRRWWDGVVGLEPARPAQGEGAQAQQQQGQAGQPQNDQQQAANGQQQHRNPMPTPEQVAQRLLNEQADRNQQQNAWWRERIRPVERAVALFVASLWPGVGEATVRARREMEERQRAEEEVERRRREEEEARERGERENEGQAGDAATAKDGPAVEGESSAVDGPEGSEGLRERRGAADTGGETAASNSS